MQQRPLLVILAISLLAKLAVWGWVVQEDPSRFLANDSVSYHHSARALVATGAFSASPEQAATPMTIRTPGYPAFLATVYSIFGPHPAAAVFFQIFLSLATIAGVWRLGAERWDRRTALLAAGLVALDVSAFGHSLILLSETLFALLVVVLLLLGQRFASVTSATLAGGLGLTLAIATHVRPVAYYLVLPLLAWVVVVAWRDQYSWRRAAFCGTLFLLPWTLLIGGWHLRNAHRTGTATFCSIQGVNLLYYRGAGIVARRDGISMEEARQQLGKGRYRELHPETRDWSEERLRHRWRQEGTALIVEHPILFAEQQVRGLGAIFLSSGEHTLGVLLAVPRLDSGPLGDLRRLDAAGWLERWLVERWAHFLPFLFAMGYLVLIYAGSASWLGRRVASREVRAWDVLAWGMVLYLAIVSAGPEAYHRFRVPLTPILALYAASTLTARRRVRSPTEVQELSEPV